MMDLIELDSSFSVVVDPVKVVSVVAYPSQKLLFCKIPPKIVVTLDNGKEYHLSVTQEGTNLDLLYSAIVKRINDARKETTDA
jgi:hypothetical protein